MQVQALDASFLRNLLQRIEQRRRQAVAPIVGDYEEPHDFDCFRAVERELWKAVVVRDVADDCYQFIFVMLIVGASGEENAALDGSAYIVRYRGVVELEVWEEDVARSVDEGYYLVEIVGGDGLECPGWICR